MANLFEKSPRPESEDIHFRPFDDETADEMARQAAAPEPQEVPDMAESRPEPIAEERPNPETGATLSANTSGNIQMKLVAPQSGQDVLQIADYLIGGCAVILNTEHMNVQDMTRMMDFLEGVLYTIGGKHRRSADKIFVLTPRSVSIAD